MTITSYTAEKALVSGPVAATLPGSLKGSGVVGLGLAVGALRRPFAANALAAPASRLEAREVPCLQPAGPVRRGPYARRDTGESRPRLDQRGPRGTPAWRPVRHRAVREGRTRPARPPETSSRSPGVVTAGLASGAAHGPETGGPRWPTTRAGAGTAVSRPSRGSPSGIRGRTRPLGALPNLSGLKGSSGGAVTSAFGPALTPLASGHGIHRLPDRWRARQLLRREHRLQDRGQRGPECVDRRAPSAVRTRRLVPHGVQADRRKGQEPSDDPATWRRDRDLSTRERLADSKRLFGADPQGSREMTAVHCRGATPHDALHGSARRFP
jgi:hypothetical protein